MSGWFADKSSAASDPEDKALLGETVHGVTGSHPADAEFLAKLGVRWKLVAGRQPGQALPNRQLDLAITRSERLRGFARRVGQHHSGQMYSYLDKTQVGVVQWKLTLPDSWGSTRAQG